MSRKVLIAAKLSKNMFAYSFVSENSNHYFCFEKKTCIFSDGGRLTPLLHVEVIFLRAP